MSIQELDISESILVALCKMVVDRDSLLNDALGELDDRNEEVEELRAYCDELEDIRRKLRESQKINVERAKAMEVQKHVLMREKTRIEGYRGQLAAANANIIDLESEVNTLRQEIDFYKAQLDPYEETISDGIDAAG